MSTTIDHLRIDHHITVLHAFSDTAGVAMRAGDRGILRELSFDQLRMEIHLGIEHEKQMVRLVFPLKAIDGPRNGHMREYFELGGSVPDPNSAPMRTPGERTMIMPAQRQASTAESGPDWWSEAQELERLGRDEEAEQLIMRSVPHIGSAASIAEMYAQRMRTFQSAGDEVNAITAFKKAVDWMANYASWATSGGEGAALSYERDRFREALVREFGYDPTLPHT